MSDFIKFHPAVLKFKHVDEWIERQIDRQTGTVSTVLIQFMHVSQKKKSIKMEMSELAQKCVNLLLNLFMFI
jgi:hypothetical protein